MTNAETRLIAYLRTQTIRALLTALLEKNAVDRIKNPIRNTVRGRPELLWYLR